MDIRVERTRRMLCEAMSELLRVKQLSSITVSELCERSTVRRATFYRHFEDIRAFTRYYLDTLTQRFLGEIDNESDLDELMPYARSMHRHMLEFARDNKVLFQHTMGFSMAPGTMDMVIAQVADGIISRIESSVATGKVSTVASPTDIGTYYAAGLTHDMRQWILGNDTRSIDDLVSTGTHVLASMVGICRQGS